MASADPLVWLAVLALIVGAIGGSTPLWKSTRLSPDSIQRRTYWLCCVLVVVFGFASQLPNIPGALFVAGLRRWFYWHRRLLDQPPQNQWPSLRSLCA